MKIILKKLRMENFKGFKEAEFDFYDYTKVSGANGLGKSTLAAAYMWLFWNIDYSLCSNPNVRRKVGRKPINDVLVMVEAAVWMDGKEVTARKVQKRTFKKDGSFTDDNTYFINDAPKTLRDFNGYFGFDMDVFKLCSNVNAFLAQKPKEMREFLFGLMEDISNRDVAQKFPELSELASLLEKYTAEELTAMNKASIAKLTKKQNSIPAAIAENKRYLVDDTDTAELELQRNALEEKIGFIREQMDDSEKARNEWQKKADEIMGLQFNKADMEHSAMDQLRRERLAIQEDIDAAERGFSDAMRVHSEAESRIAFLEKEGLRKSQEKDMLLRQWKEEKARTFPRENDEFVGITESDLTCPVCGQPLPEAMREEKIARGEADKAAFYKAKEADREAFEQNKNDALAAINEKGRSIVAGIKADEAEIEGFRAAIEQAKSDKLKFNKAKADAMERLKKLPEKPDMSENQAYEALCAEIRKKDEVLKAGDSGADYRAALRRQMEEAEREVEGVKARLRAVERNAEYEQRIADLEASRLTLEQKKADAERVIDLLNQLDEKKNGLLADKINSHFRYVKWDLFSRAKNGSYKKDYCRPVIDGKDYGVDTNTGLEILARLDIAMAAQKATGIDCPIFLDFGESIDPWRIPKGESQLIVLCRTDDTELRIEPMAASEEY